MNVVQEMAIAANIPMPKVYIIDDTAPNAFATGRDPQHASVAITTGLLEKLDREELQGVIGHELSHVRNLDIRFTLLVGVLVGSIALLADFFLRFTFWSGVTGRRREGGRAAAAEGRRSSSWSSRSSSRSSRRSRRLVQLAVSRQREYLADASTVELTRNPYGLERALAKIAADQEVLEVANRATQHLYFANPIKKFEERSSGLFSTHPPIVDRINRLRELTGEGPLAADRRGEPRRPRLGVRLRLADLDRGPAARGILPTADGQPEAGWPRAEIAQLVEHATENRGVASSNLALGTTARGGRRLRAEVAQLVEHHLAKVRVAGSSPVFRSTPSSTS